MFKNNFYGMLITVWFVTISSRIYADTNSVPVVYFDNNILIRSAILNSEEELFHLGDRINLVVLLEFDLARVRVTNLDETLLTESWRESNWFASNGPPQVTTNQEDGITRLEAIYTFQILACPIPAVQCPGGKTYVMDNINLGMELLDDNGRPVSTIEVNFRPSPGLIGVPSALSVVDGKLDPFNSYFPGRAFGMPVSVTINSIHSLVLFIFGVALISTMVVAPGVRSWLRHRVTTKVGILGKRWEHVIDRLQTHTLMDAEFREGIRVAITWYCHDELKINPVHWTELDNSIADETLQKLRKIYFLATASNALSPEQNRDCLDQLVQTIKQR